MLKLAIFAPLPGLLCLARSHSLFSQRDRVWVKLSCPQEDSIRCYFLCGCSQGKVEPALGGNLCGMMPFLRLVAPTYRCFLRKLPIMGCILYPVWVCPPSTFFEMGANPESYAASVVSDFFSRTLLRLRCLE